MSLASAAMLVTLKITQWSARKLDRKVSDELCDSKSAARSSANVNKQLIPKKHLNKIQTLVNTIRNYHYVNTLAWEHKGSDILPSARYFKYMGDMQQYKLEFNAAVEEFLTDYPIILQQVSTSLHDLYNVNDYPTVEQIRTKFLIDMSVSPIPTSGDFRIDLEQKELSKLQAELDSRMDIARVAAETELFSRLYTVVAKAALTLSDPIKVFRNSLILNIKEEAERAPDLNVNDNTDIQRIAADLTKTCKGIDIAELRNQEQPCYREIYRDKFKLVLTQLDTAHKQVV